jgi:hypothetical protein
MEAELKGKTDFTSLAAELDAALSPFENLIALANRGDDQDEFNDLVPILEIILEKCRDTQAKIINLVSKQVGEISLQRVKFGESLKFQGKFYSNGDLVRVSINPLEGQDILTE